VTLLVISPDYASHLLPLATLATAWRDRGERVVVATGSATASVVDSFGFERVELRLGRGSNPGTIRPEEQPEGEDDSLRGFFDATRSGMVATLRYQAQERLTDLMWQPVVTARAVQDVVHAVAPDAILVDHLAFSARLALDAARVRYGDVVLGHPSALPVGDEMYGYPPAWPAAFHPEPSELAELRALCARVSDSFTAEWNNALAELDPLAAPARDAFAGHGDVLLFNYPEELDDPDRRRMLPPHTHLGSAVRAEAVDPEVDAWLASADPFIYLSFGSFLSARGDVLARVVAAIRATGLRAAVALGSASLQEVEQYGPLPAEWLVREFLPQVTLLDRAALAVTHGGNNSVTEAVTAGVPMLVLPFSTDQFAGAAAVERTALGEALDPNAATVEQLTAALHRLLAADRSASAALAASLQRVPGSERAFAALASSTN
jgi:UDP:flavonoid glycosyltransferase YjiC (YdhE family)